MARERAMSTFKRRLFMRAASGLALVPFAPIPSYALGDKPVRIIVPLSVGSTGDTVSRRMVEGLTKRLGHPVYVENLPGAGGMAGTAKMVKAPKDGNTLAIVSSGHVINPGIYPEMPFDSLKDITPIAVIGNAPQVLLVNAALQVKNLKELIAYAKAKPNALKYGSSGNGTSLHLLGVKLCKDAGIRMVHVPYRGNSQMLSDLLGGQVMLAFQSTTQAGPYVKSGKLRAIAVTSKERSRLLPDVPTFTEQGMEFDLSTWMAVIGPAGMDPALVDRINHAVSGTLSQADVKSWFDTQDWNLTSMSPAQARTFFVAEQAKYLKLVKDSGASMQ
jgi:tripartite-type tricarboxylate transporter receptor subunit TctC